MSLIWASAPGVETVLAVVAGVAGSTPAGLVAMWFAAAHVNAVDSRWCSTLQTPARLVQVSAWPAAPGWVSQYSTTYTFRLFALDADGPGRASNEAMATTGSRPRTGGGPGGGGGAPPEPEPEPQPDVFKDVPAASVHATNIAKAVALGILALIIDDPEPEADDPETDPETEDPEADDPETDPETEDPEADPEADPEGEFKPDVTVTRGAIAAPMVKLAELLGRDCPAGASNSFTDVPDSQAHSVGCLHALGITTGTSDTTYDPEQSLTRAQTASMLIRLWRSLGRECPQSAATPFADVGTDNVHASDISCLRALGITNGTSATTYSPDRHLNRAEIATFVIRLYDAAQPPDDDDTDG